MLGWIVSGLLAVYGGGAAYGRMMRRLENGAYPSPQEAEDEMAALAAAHADLCRREVIGHSTEGRPLHAFRLRGMCAGDAPRPQLLITAHIHAVEYIGAYVARSLSRRLVEGYGCAPKITDLLDRADVWLVPLLNHDGAARVWQRGGWSSLGGTRFTANDVDPNRNFPGVPVSGRAAWNSARDRPGSAYYRGPYPLSEPECLALARLCARQGFCAAVNFHSFGGVVFLPQVLGGDVSKATGALAAFQGVFQAHQRFLRYRPVAERSASIVGQLDPFLLNAFGTPSVTIEVSRPGLHLLWPLNTLNIFWWANPWNPQRWADNDRDAAIYALWVLLERTGGTPCTPVYPQLADGIEAPPTC